MLKEILKNIAKDNINQSATFTFCGYSEPKLTEKIKAEIIKDEK